MKCPGCAGLSYCRSPYLSCELKRELRLLDVLQSKQSRIERLEIERDLRDARVLVKEASKKC